MDWGATVMAAVAAAGAVLSAGLVLKTGGGGAGWASAGIAQLIRRAVEQETRIERNTLTPAFSLRERGEDDPVTEELVFIFGSLKNAQRVS
jgi:hypothetical protein